MKTELLYSLFKNSNGIATDSRKVRSDEIFFALWGENYNGNRFASEALDNGASWAVIDDAAFETDRTILVDDCLFELQALASHYRKELNVPVLAITGTNGKTTTKELIAAIISRRFKTHYTKGNLNNHIGVPLTLLSAPEGTEMMIIEMGASHTGEIKTLCQIAKPDYGIITNIGAAHLEGFGSRDGVIKAKTELYEYLRRVNGIALYNDKDPLLTDLIFKMINRAVPFSDPTGTELSVKLMPSELTLKIKVSYQHQQYIIDTNLFGNYNLENLKAAIATSLFLGVRMEDIRGAIEEFYPANNRSEVKITERNTLICDSYNANPTSMLLALESFSLINHEEKLIILGDMLELGERCDEEHLNLLKFLRSYNTENIILVGPVFNRISAESEFKSFNDINMLARFLEKKPVRGRTILIKGSRGIGLERIYHLL